jgi:hypothetical protein
MKIPLRFRAVFLLVLGAVLTQGSSCFASEIDLRGLPGNHEQANFGQPNTTFYAQSVVADGSFMSSAILQLRATHSADVVFNFLITGARVDSGGGLGFAPDLSNILFTTGPRTAKYGDPLTDFTITPNIAVAPGTLLFLVVEALSYPSSDYGAVMATQANGPDEYPSGEFVWIGTAVGDTYETVNRKTWTHWGFEDLAFEANFLGSNVTVFATGLQYPRGLKFGPDRNLYVAEAGSGGSTSTDGICDQVLPPSGPYMGGFTARVSKIASDGTVSTVADNLPSGINAFGDVLGVADVAFIGNRLYALSAGGGCSHGFADNDAAILRVDPDGTTHSIADLSEFQKSHPVANPPVDFEPDGAWYSMIAQGNQLIAVEPNHGELDSIQASQGVIKRIADISKIQGHSVPTAVASDGTNFFVGNLGVFPIVDGSQVILKITPSGQARIVASGFTTILGLAFDSHGKLYVLENTTGGNPYPTPGTGKILRLSSDGSTTEIATGLNLPTAMTFGPDGNIYVSSWGFGSPGMGEIDKVTITP